MLKSPNAKVRQAAAELIAQRKIMGAIPQLLASAGDTDPAVVTTSLRALGDIGGLTEAPALIKILTTGASLPATENALTAIYQRSRDTAAADALSAALPTAPTPAKLSLLRLMRRVGGPKALAAVRAAWWVD